MFENFNLSELIEIEKALSIICKKYENSSRVYDGSIANGPLYERFKKYNDFHSNVIQCMEKIIDNYASK